MNTRSDQQLLQDYVATRSEAAFAELTRRHIDLVYSAAMRRVGDAHHAQDVTQGTFAALAQHAGRLAEHPVLSGWLHRTTHNIAVNHVRSNARRQAREQEAVTMNELLSGSPDVTWEAVAPHLDAALDDLDIADRDAVLLRYFEKKSAREMATQLGISDDAAQKRVSRAVERLREFFAKRGVTVGASGLAVVISANAVQAAPVGLALTIATAAALTGTTLATTATVTTIKTIAMTALQKTIVTATIAVLAGAGIYEARQNARLREQNQMLLQERAPLAEQMTNFQKEYDDVTNRLAALRDDNERLKRNTGELLKLRADVSQLRRKVADMNSSYLSHKARDEQRDVIKPDPDKVKWEWPGRSTPAKAADAVMWAISTKTNLDELVRSFVTESEMDQFDPRVWSYLTNLNPRYIVGVQNNAKISETNPLEAQTDIVIVDPTSGPAVQIGTMRKVGEDWKIVFKTTRDSSGNVSGIKFGDRRITNQNPDEKSGP